MLKNSTSMFVIREICFNFPFLEQVGFHSTVKNFTCFGASMFGSLHKNALGFDACQSTEASVQNLRVGFNPQPMGFFMELPDYRIAVVATERVHLGNRVYVVDVTISRKDNRKYWPNLAEPLKARSMKELESYLRYPNYDELS